MIVGTYQYGWCDYKKRKRHKGCTYTKERPREDMKKVQPASKRGFTANQPYLHLDLFFFSTSLLEYKCSTTRRQFLLHNKVNQPHAYIHPLAFVAPYLGSWHAIPPLPKAAWNCPSFQPPSLCRSCSLDASPSRPRLLQGLCL